MARSFSPQFKARDRILKGKSGDRTASVVAGYARQLSHPAYESLLRSESLLRRLVPVLIVMFLAIVAIARWVQLQSESEFIRSYADSEMHFIAELIEERLQNAELELGTSANGLNIQNLVSDAVPSRYLEKKRQVVLTDREGIIVASLPYMPDRHGSSLESIFGDVTLLTTFGERANTRKILTPNYGEAIAVHRILPTPFGGVTLVQPEDAIYTDWRKTVSLNVTLFVGTSSILLVILYAYFAQCQRAREADTIYAEVQDRFDTALMRGGCGLWDWDLSRGQFYWSKSMFELLGREPRDEIVSFAEVNEMVHPDDADLYQLACVVMEKGMVHVEEIFRMRNIDNQWIWIRLKVEMARTDKARPRLVGIAEDITEQRAIEQASNQKDMRLRDAIENLPEAFVLWDDRKRLVMCNSKYQQLHNLMHDDVQPGMRYEDIMDRASSPDISSQLIRDLHADESTRTMEARLSDGRWLQINERHTKDGGFVSVGTDITTIKRSEAKLKDQEKRLMATISDLEQSRQTLEIQKQKLAEMAEKYALEKNRAEAANKAKSEFLANISHELRTPLNAVIGFSEIMNEGLFGPLGSEKYQEYARDIRESGTYLLGMINDVLDMSKIEAGRFVLDYETFNLDEMIEETLRIVRHQSEDRGIEIQESVSSKIKLEADRRAIKQILINLLTNAVKFSRDNGRIQIRARQRGETITITLEDNGIGISKQDLKKLGRPFEQVQNQFTKSHKGSGLGLAISRSLIEMHGGAMKIRSTEGVGTIVSFRLPVHCTEEQKLARASSPAA
ncbi:MAG: ATP-binding protein [Pseudomonadota bacterium]